MLRQEEAQKEVSNRQLLTTGQPKQIMGETALESTSHVIAQGSTDRVARTPTMILQNTTTTIPMQHSSQQMAFHPGDLQSYAVHAGDMRNSTFRHRYSPHNLQSGVDLYTLDDDILKAFQCSAANHDMQAWLDYLFTDISWPEMP